jgi:hypothetical protein
LQLKKKRKACSSHRLTITKDPVSPKVLNLRNQQFVMEKQWYQIRKKKKIKNKKILGTWEHGYDTNSIKLFIKKG